MPNPEDFIFDQSLAFPLISNTDTHLTEEAKPTTARVITVGMPGKGKSYYITKLHADLIEGSDPLQFISGREYVPTISSRPVFFSREELFPNSEYFLEPEITFQQNTYDPFRVVGNICQQVGMAVGTGALMLTGIGVVPPTLALPRAEWVQASGVGVINRTRRIGGTEEKESFSNSLLSAIKCDHIEDGMFHPAEDFLNTSLGEHPDLTLQWVQEIFNNNYDKHPAITGAILRLLGRLPTSQVGLTGMFLALRGLQHPETEVRDSSVRALESWGGSWARTILEGHLQRERVPRLARYIQQVILDLTN